jgi:hypothetical protein
MGHLRVNTGDSRQWCCVAVTLSFNLTPVWSHHINQSPNCPTLQIWPLLTRFCFQGLNPLWKVSSFRQLNRSKKICYETYALSHKMCSRTETTLKGVHRQWRGVLSRRQVLLSCKLINKCFKKRKFGFLLDRPRVAANKLYVMTIYSTKELNLNQYWNQILVVF